MLLRKLIKHTPKNRKNTFISGLSSDSNEVKKNFIFFAIKGNKINGENFIKSAIKKGATVIVCSKNCKINLKILLLLRPIKLELY